MKINWTSNARKTFEQILDWLSGNWTNKEVEKFLDQTESTIEHRFLGYDVRYFA